MATKMKILRQTKSKKFLKKKLRQTNKWIKYNYKIYLFLFRAVKSASHDDYEERVSPTYNEVKLILLLLSCLFIQNHLRISFFVLLGKVVSKAF